MTLNKQRTKQKINQLAQRLNISPQHCAEGILQIANTHIENAIRVISTEKGYDPRAFAMIPFGGAGGLHACEVARNLGIRTIIVPPNPGVLSAFGMLVSPTIRYFSKTVLLTIKNSSGSRGLSDSSNSNDSSDIEKTNQRLHKLFLPLIKKAKREFIQEGLLDMSIESHRRIKKIDYKEERV